MARANPELAEDLAQMPDQPVEQATLGGRAAQARALALPENGLSSTSPIGWLRYAVTIATAISATHALPKKIGMPCASHHDGDHLRRVESGKGKRRCARRS